MRYTHQPVLSREQVETFRRQGYLIVRGLFGPKEMADIAQWTNRLQEWPEVRGQYMMYFEESRKGPGSRILCRLENFLPYHDQLRTITDGPKLRGAVSQLFGEEAVLFKDKINFKLPGAAGFTPHQDVQAGWSQYGSIHITALVSIDPSTVENGCLEMAGGYHDKGLIGDEWEPLTEDALREMDFINVETQPGDAVFFDSFAPHKSGPNVTEQARRVLYITYGKSSDGDQRQQYYADKRKSYPPDIEREPGKTYVYRV
jgi:ectoine hydroxylase-related dioxygenase (phytanoyl-CoA dioxygenase family)